MLTFFSLSEILAHTSCLPVLVSTEALTYTEFPIKDRMLG